MGYRYEFYTYRDIACRVQPIQRWDSASSLIATGRGARRRIADLTHGLDRDFGGEVRSHLDLRQRFLLTDVAPRKILPLQVFTPSLDSKGSVQPFVGAPARNHPDPWKVERSKMKIDLTPNVAMSYSARAVKKIT